MGEAIQKPYLGDNETDTVNDATIIFREIPGAIVIAKRGMEGGSRSVTGVPAETAARPEEQHNSTPATEPEREVADWRSHLRGPTKRVVEAIHERGLTSLRGLQNRGK